MKQKLEMKKNKRLKKACKYHLMNQAFSQELNFDIIRIN